MQFNFDEFEDLIASQTANNSNEVVFTPSLLVSTINQNFNYSRLNSLQKGNSSNKINNEENIKIERYNLKKSELKPKENIISTARII